MKVSLGFESTKQILEVESKRLPGYRSLTVHQEPDADSVILKFDNPVAISINNWEGSQADCEIRITTEILDRLAEEWMKRKG